MDGRCRELRDLVVDEVADPEQQFEPGIRHRRYEILVGLHRGDVVEFRRDEQGWNVPM